jgi:hypothetical protein
MDADVDVSRRQGADDGAPGPDSMPVVGNHLKKRNIIMNTLLDVLRKKFQAKLDDSIYQLKTAKTHLEYVEQETGTAIEAKLKIVKETVRVKKHEIVSAKDKVEEMVKAKEAETKEAIAEWKTNRDVKKLEKRAERAEEIADTSVAQALYYAWKAEVAILEAVGARQDADNAL